MRFDKFTTRFQQAFADAQSMAVGQDNPYIEPPHLLLALLEQDDGGHRPRCWRAPARMSGPLKEGLRAAHRSVCPRSKAMGGEVNVSRDLANLLNVTDKEAQKRGDQFIASELFLLALTDDKGETGKLLKAQGRHPQGAGAGRSKPCAAGRACRARRPRASAKH